MNEKNILNQIVISSKQKSIAIWDPELYVHEMTTLRPHLVLLEIFAPTSKD